MSFGSNLQFMRKMHNSMTQEVLAEKMGVSRQTVSKWEMDGAFPEMEKAIALSNLFNCSLDELLKEDVNSDSSAYQNIRIEKKAAFRYLRYAVISPEPEEDAISHIENIAAARNIQNPEIVGCDFPFVSQEQANVYRLRGYCAICILPEDYKGKDCDIAVQPAAKYAAITIRDPLQNPFVLIPNAYKTLFRYIEVNGYRCNRNREYLDCYEKKYEKDGISYMDVYIVIFDV